MGAEAPRESSLILMTMLWKISKRIFFIPNHRWLMMKEKDSFGLANLEQNQNQYPLHLFSSK